MPHPSDFEPRSTPVVFAAPAAFTNGWGNFGNGYNPAGYYKDVLGFVHLRGTISAGVIGSSAFTLPLGFRPANNEIYAAIANLAFAVATVHPDGTVIPFQGSNAFFSFDGMTFLAA